MARRLLLLMLAGTAVASSSCGGKPSGSTCRPDQGAGAYLVCPLGEMKSCNPGMRCVQASDAQIQCQTDTHANPHAPIRRMTIPPPIVTDVAPLAGDKRGGTVITIGGHAFVDTSNISVTPLQKMSNGPRWGLQCQFMMSPPVRVPAVFDSESSIRCTVPPYTGQDGVPEHLPVNMSASKFPLDGRVQVKVTHDGEHWSKAAYYVYGVGDCCNPHPSPGCMNPILNDCVCRSDPDCCDPRKMWDGVCVQNLRTLACENMGAVCPPSSLASLNTKWAKIHFKPEEVDRNALQRDKDMKVKDEPLEIAPQKVNNTPASEPHQGPSSDEAYVPFADQPRKAKRLL